MVLPSAAEIRDATCVACPGQSLALGSFDVAPRPGPGHPYDPTRGYRVDAATGTPTCVHAYRVGVPPAAYASQGLPLPDGSASPPSPAADDLELPDDPTLLEAWLVAVVRSAPSAGLGAALRRAETTALTRFPPGDVVDALRRVLTCELTRRR
ncbi:hypothetical protein AB0M46_45425 [Dactylosporangium sp. NPDC051485]|uniref:hypothetical protein n=1 Tax=Dactylosporangium sp. NPDC051485 TaxID=3154846 RepID=UPI00341FC40A